MDLPNLYSLLTRFSETKQRLEAAALSTPDPAAQAEFEQQVKKTAIVMADLRGEILARELPGQRTSITAEDFEAHLDRILHAYAWAAHAQDQVIRQSA